MRGLVVCLSVLGGESEFGEDVSTGLEDFLHSLGVQAVVDDLADEKRELGDLGLVGYSVLDGVEGDGGADSVAVCVGDEAKEPTPDVPVTASNS